MTQLSQIGVVVIGRNEGARLVACLESLRGCNVVYVDSGSTDGSVQAAQRLGAIVVELDTSIPFTAARARNAGFDALSSEAPDLAFVQFVDGDCQVEEGWLENAADFLAANTGCAVVCGRRRERFPTVTIYNSLCDREWDTPIGETLACGGDCLVRVRAFVQVGGYADDLIAGEEPEMCVRLRSFGWKIYRLDAEMTQHDANIVRFSQWWRRSQRTGHAFAEVALRHIRSPYGIWQRNVARALFWGLALPLFSLLAGSILHPAFLLLLLAFPLQVARIARREGGGHTGWLYASFAILAKFPEAQGIAQYAWNRLTQRRQTLIEYK